MAAESPPPAAEPVPVTPPAAPKPATPPPAAAPRAENTWAALVVVTIMVLLLGVIAFILMRMRDPAPAPGPGPAPVPTPVVVPNDVAKLQVELKKTISELDAAKMTIHKHSAELAERDASVAHWQVLFKESCDKVAQLKEELAALKNTPQTELKQGLPTKKSRVLDELPPEPPPAEPTET